MRTIGVIPARMASNRFPAKVLALISGKPLIQHVWEKAIQCKELNEVLIACDHEDIFNAAKKFNARVVMTNPNHPSGSDRIAEAVKYLNVDIVTNIQGDEPFIEPRTVDALVQLLKHDPNTLMGTVIKEITDIKDLESPHVVKCVIDHHGMALYFSRATIPYPRHQENFLKVKKYKHLGLYAYRKDFLLEFTTWPKGTLESAEELEQLRALEHGIRIKTTLTTLESIAVDTPQDLQRAQEWYEKSNSIKA